MSLDAKWVRRMSRTLVQNPSASVATGTATARITGIHPALFLGIGLAYFADSGGQPAGFGANAFTLIAYDINDNGKKAQLSATPINGAAGMAAPDKWEGSTTLPEIELRHAWVGMGAGDVGHWEVIVTLGPAVDMCAEDFRALAGAVDIAVPAVVVA